MKTRVERLPDHPARVLLEVEVEAARVETAIEQAYRRIVRQLRIPGFRPGRAPRKVVELHVGKEALLQEAVDELIPELYLEATQQNELDPVARAHIDIVDMGIDKPLKFTAEVDVKPDVMLGEYEGISVERRRPKVDDAAVERVIEQTRQQMAQLVHVDKEALEDGDYAVLDFDGFIDGEPFQGGAARGELVQMGNMDVAPEFDEQLVGMAPEEEREVEITFPDTARQDLAGQRATFRVKLLEIKQRKIPDLDDEFAKDTGRFDTLEEMRSDFRDRLVTAAVEEADANLQGAIVRQVAAGAQVNIPEVMVDHELEHLVREVQIGLAQRGLRWEQYLSVLETTEAAWKDEHRDDAALRVKQNLTLEAVGRAQGLQPDEDAIQERLLDMIGPNKDDSELEEMLADEDWHTIARDGLLRTRALDWLVEHANVTEVEYEADDEANNEADTEADAENQTGETDENPGDA